MARFYDKNRRESTVKRDNMVHGAYRELMDELGEVGGYVARSYVYERIREKTGLCAKTIANILNHSKLCGGG